MRSFIAALFAVGALATPAFLAKRDCNDTCMTYDQAYTVANNFKTLISNYSAAAADAYMAVDVVDYSDSVSTLIDAGCPNGPATLGAATFSSRAAFELGQGSQPDIPFELLNMWYSCEGPVVIRWRSAQTPQSITGNIVLETVRGNGSEPWVISTVHSEFNSGAWLVNLGVFTPTCDTAAKSKRAALPFRKF